MREISSLSTSRLTLRKMEINDAAILYKYWSDNSVTRHMNINSFTDIVQAEQMISFLNGLSDEGKLIRWTIINRSDGLIVGSCGYNSFSIENLRGEIGYELGREFWGQGLMTEALTVIIKYGFSTIGLNRIQALVEKGNIASQKLLAKLGFQQDGLLREYEVSKGVPVDLFIYSLIKRDIEKSTIKTTGPLYL